MTANSLTSELSSSRLKGENRGRAAVAISRL
jgi:hypothetical protein